MDVYKPFYGHARGHRNGGGRSARSRWWRNSGHNTRCGFIHGLKSLGSRGFGALRKFISMQLARQLLLCSLTFGAFGVACRLDRLPVRQPARAPAHTTSLQGARVSDFTAGPLHSCALLPQGPVLCWGMLSVPARRHQNVPPQPEDYARRLREDLPRVHQHVVGPIQAIAGPVTSIWGQDWTVCADRAGATSCLVGYWQETSVAGHADSGFEEGPPPGTSVDAPGWSSCSLDEARLTCLSRGEFLEQLPISFVPRAVSRTRSEYCALDQHDSLRCAPRDQRAFSRESCVSGTDYLEQTRDAMRRAFSSEPAIGSIAGIAAERDTLLVWTRDGRVFERFPRDSHEASESVMREIPLPSPVDSVAAGAAHACALLRTGRIYCWGSSASGQLGNGSYDDSLRPVLVSSLNDVIAVRAGIRHTCALGHQGALYCWGDSSLGRLGTGTAMPQARPRFVEIPERIVYAAAGWGHTCALTASGRVLCWGLGYNGQTGESLLATPRECFEEEATRSRARPNEVLRRSDLLSIRALGDVTCALGRSDGYCWGDNLRGRFAFDAEFASAGLNSAPISYQVITDPVAVPVNRARLATERHSAPPILAGPEYLQVVQGDNHACALTRTGEVACAGDNQWGELGDGTFISRAVPRLISGLGNVVGLTAGSTHTCAWLRDGRLACWGNNDYSQLSEPSAIDPAVPQLVAIPGDAGAIPILNTGDAGTSIPPR